MVGAKHLRAAGVAIMLAASAGAPALAADLGYPAATEAPQAEPMVEWGSGWYLRGDIGPYQDLGVAVSATEKAKKRNSVEFSGGAGYQFNNWFRMDATYEHFMNRTRSGSADQVVCPYTARGLHQDNYDATGAIISTTNVGHAYDLNERCNVTTGSRLGVQGALLNAYADLGKYGIVTPYIGAGAGVFMHRASAATRYFKASDGSPYAADLTAMASYPLVWLDPINGSQAVDPTTGKYPAIAFDKQKWDRKYSRTVTKFGWALMAGVGIDLADGLKLDIGYRYLNAGQFKSMPDPRNGAIKTTNLDVHQVKVGLRYQID